MEWLLLLAILSLLYSMHTFGIKVLSFNSFVLIFFLFNLVLMVRLNLFQTRHSFIEQRSLASFLLFGYLILCECGFRQSSLKTKPTSYLLSPTTLFSLITIVLMLGFSSLLFSKILFVSLGVFFFKYLHPQALGSKTFFHVLFFLFFFIWGIYFTFFYLMYSRVAVLSTEIFYIFTDTFSFVNTFCYKKLIFKLLESVTFSIVSEGIRTFGIFFGTTVSVFLNNWFLLYIIYVLFILLW